MSVTTPVPEQIGPLKLTRAAEGWRRYFRESESDWQAFDDAILRKAISVGGHRRIGANHVLLAAVERGLYQSRWP